MKKLIVVALVLAVSYGYAQKPENGRENRQHRIEQFKEMTPEQIANLKTKRMTLDLDLNDQQQDEIYKLNLDEVKYKRSKAEARQKLNQDESPQGPKADNYQNINERLDRQIENKRKMRTVLNDNQYQKWERRMKKGTHKRKMRQGRKGKRH